MAVKSESPRNPRHTISIVLVEDDPILRKSFSTWIEHCPGMALSATYSDGESAITGIEKVKPDVALLDIHLPGISGIECVRNLKPKLPSTQFVMLTIYQDSKVIFEALTAGATGYLTKSTPRAELLNALQNVHCGGSPMNSQIARMVVHLFRKSKNEEDAFTTLSPREHEVLTLMAKGYLLREIGQKLGISAMTLNTYNRRIYEKLQVHSRAQAVAIFNSQERRSS